jgi:hypothetical protein
MSEQRNQQKQQGGQGGQKPGQQQQAEVDKKRERWREIGQKQDEQDKKRREAGIVPGDDKGPGGGLVGD